MKTFLAFAAALALLMMAVTQLKPAVKETVEVPVIKEVIKEVPVVEEVEKLVYVDKPVYVDRVIYRDVVKEVKH